MTITLNLDDLTLQRGSHTPDGEFCLLEAVAYIAGEPWTDHPQCVDPVLAAFGRAWNDALDDDTRNRLLKPFIPKLVGTRSTPAVQDARAFMATDWAVRTYTPVWLRAAGLDDEAAELERLPALTSTQLCRDAMPTITKARQRADAASAAAWAAASAAASDAASAAAWDAARAAAWAAAWAAASAAASDAASAAAWAAAWATARATARAAASAAAWAAASAAASDAASAAAWAAAWDALKPHVEMLQTSAVDLYERMIAVGGTR